MSVLCILVLYVVYSLSLLLLVDENDCDNIKYKRKKYIISVLVFNSVFFSHELKNHKMCNNSWGMQFKTRFFVALLSFYLYYLQAKGRTIGKLKIKVNEKYQNSFKSLIEYGSQSFHVDA